MASDQDQQTVAKLTLIFLGSFQVSVNDRPITQFRSNNLRGLLVYLALNAARPLDRESLATLFWPSEPESVAKTNLRQIIYHLRKSLGEEEGKPLLDVNRRTVQIHPVVNLDVDVQRFLKAIEHDDLEGAGILYAGELLPGFVCDSPNFEAWLRLEREKLNRTALETLSQLANQKLTQAEYGEAKSIAMKQLEIEPWREMAHYQLMQALALSGEKEAAIAQFDQLTEVLEAEMGISPQQESFDLIRQIENDELSSRFAFAQSTLPLPFQAPAVPDYLVGREDEMEEIGQLLLTAETQKNIVALVGMGGIGKTTLAASVAHQLKEYFPDGILWGNTLLSSAENILEVWARGYGNDFSKISDLDSLAVAVRSLLANKTVLIVLDNVTEQTDLTPFLQPGSNCSILLTTRSHDAASSNGAHIFQLTPLAPENSTALISQILEQEDVVEDPAAQQIGELLDHLPLAVEITAQLLKARPRMTLARMVERLQDAQQRRGLKISNKAVRASFELSWEFLSAELRMLFSQLGVFEGRSFTLEALQAVVETDPFDTEDDLYSLVSRSLVQLDGEDRYKQHPLMADFAAEKLEDPRPVLEKLTSFYLDYAGSNQLNLDQLQPEWGNMLAVIERLPESDGWSDILAFSDALHDSWFRFGRYEDANKVYALAQTAVERTGSDAELVKTLLRWAEIKLEQSAYNDSWNLLELALPICLTLEDSDGVAKTKYFQSYVAFDQGEFAIAELLARESLELFLESDDLLNQMKVNDLLGWINYEIGEGTHRADEYAEAALDISKQVQIPVEAISSMRLKAFISYRNGNNSEAIEYAAKSLEVAQEYGARGEEVAALYLMISIKVGSKLYEEAKAISLQALALSRQLGLTRIEGLVHHEMSVTYLNLNDLKLALNQSEKASKIFRQIEDRLNYGYALRQAGDILQKMGQLEISHNYWSEAKEIALHLNHQLLLNQLDKRLNAT